MMLLDTSGLLALIDQREPWHEATHGDYRTATTLLTHSHVLAEFVPLCQTRGVARSMMLAFLRRLHRNPDIVIMWVDADLHDVALTRLEKQVDKTYSLCDAVSYVLMQRRSVTEALTTDRHFEQAGSHRLLA
ncbi:MAG: type II toxin-antitoxin system VapC family toxin [Chloroflexi bacterium]|nr:type II toxin-antitoxin system VapC family toxin [Chloroflexota bacterium]